MPDRWCPSNSPNFYDQIEEKIDGITKWKNITIKKLSLEEIERLADLLPNRRSIK